MCSGVTPHWTVRDSRPASSQNRTGVSVEEKRKQRRHCAFPAAAAAAAPPPLPPPRPIPICTSAALADAASSSPPNCRWRPSSSHTESRGSTGTSAPAPTADTTGLLERARVSVARRLPDRARACHARRGAVGVGHSRSRRGQAAVVDAALEDAPLGVPLAEQPHDARVAGLR